MILDCLIKIVYYEMIKRTIDIVGQLKIIINVVMRYYGFLKLIISN